MISISNVKNPDYLVKHSQHGYLSENDSETGMFLGRGSLLKKRHGKEVDREGFYDLINYKKENLIKEIKNDDDEDKKKKKKENHGTELVFSAPKDWSILFNLVDDETREKMAFAWQDMIKHTVNTIEQNTFYRKKIKGKVIYETAKAVEFAVFNHHTARTIDDRPDPQEHTHITIGPKVLGQDGKYYSHTLKDLVKEKSTDEAKKQSTLHYFDQVAQAQLAKFLQKELGLSIKRGINDSFQIEGITKEQREFFSKRSEQVKDELGDKSTPAQRQKAITQKRNKKDDYDLSVLRAEWNKEFRQLGMNRNKLNNKQKEEAKTFQQVFKDIKFIDTKQLKLYALTESKFSNKSAGQLFEEYKNDSMFKEFKPGKYINLNHKGSKDFTYNYAKGKLESFKKNVNGIKANKQSNKTNISNAKSKLDELEKQHQEKIIELSSSKNSLTKLSSELSNYEARKNELLQEIAQEEERSNSISFNM